MKIFTLFALILTLIGPTALKSQTNDFLDATHPTFHELEALFLAWKLVNEQFDQESIELEKLPKFASMGVVSGVYLGFVLGVIQEANLEGPSDINIQKCCYAIGEFLEKNQNLTHLNGADLVKRALKEKFGIKPSS